MDPAEEIVNLWLQHQGFFVMSGVRVKGGDKGLKEGEVVEAW